MTADDLNNWLNENIGWQGALFPPLVLGANAIEYVSGEYVVQPIKQGISTGLLIGGGILLAAILIYGQRQQPHRYYRGN